MQASAPHAQRGFSANNQLLTGEALAGAATRHSSKRPMWFRLRLNPFIAGRFKIRIPDKGWERKALRGHTCAVTKSRKGRDSLTCSQQEGTGKEEDYGRVQQVHRGTWVW